MCVPVCLQDIDEEKRLKRDVAEKEQEERHLADINAQVCTYSHMCVCVCVCVCVAEGGETERGRGVGREAPGGCQCAGV